MCTQKSETTREQWNRTVDKFANREIYRVEFENVDGKPHCWIYFREGEITESDYQEVKSQRHDARMRINELESLIEGFEKGNKEK